MVLANCDREGQRMTVMIGVDQDRGIGVAGHGRSLVGFGDSDRRIGPSANLVPTLYLSACVPVNHPARLTKTARETFAVPHVGMPAKR